MFSRPLSLVSLTGAAALLVIGLTGCAASGGTPTASGTGAAKSSTSSSSNSGSGSGDSAAYYNAHPCDLVTESQTQSLVGYTLQGVQSQPSSGQGKCTYDSVAPVAKPVTFGLDDTTTSTTMEAVFPNATKETFDGHAGFCSEGSGVEDSELYVDVSASAGVLFITVPTCTAADAMAKIAFGHLG